MLKKCILYIKQDMKIRNKLLVTLGLAVLIPAFLTVWVFYGHFYRNTLETVLESRMSAAYRTDSQIEDAVNQMKEISDIVSSTDLLKQVLAMGDDELGKILQNGSEEAAASLDTYKAILASHLDDYGISGIRIYCDGSTELLNQAGKKFTREDFFEPLSEIRYAYWKGIMEITGEGSRMFPGYYLTDKERKDYGGMSYVQRVDYHAQGEWKEAYVAVYRDEQFLNALLKENNRLDGEMMYVTDSRNIIVTPYMDEDIGLYVTDYESLDKELPETKTFYKKNYGKEPAYVCRYDVANMDWSLIWIIPESGIDKESKELLMKVLGTYGILLLIGIAAALWISWTFLGRLYRLKNQMRHLKSSRPTIVEEEAGKDEIGELTETYNYMVSRVNHLMEHELRTQEELNEMKIETLRAQIDPHFLYNTLDLVRGLSQKGEKEQIEELILAMTRFYRLSLNKGEKFGTVQHEIRQAESYMKIMDMRYSGHFTFAVDVSEEILNQRMPMLVFQPILENAIIHGILEKTSQKGYISLTGWKEERGLVFLISDDGAGMDEETLQAVAAGRKTSKKGSNIGIYNTNRRIQLIYGADKSGITWQSVPGQGTDVEIVIPVTKEDEP